MKRRVRIYLPESYESDSPTPVILALHGKFRNGTSFEHVTDFSNSKYNKDAIVLYPDGIDVRLPASRSVQMILTTLLQLRWTGDPYAPKLRKNNDIKYAGELLDQIESSFCVDKSRIYVTGFSNGGGLAHLLACDPILSSRIAAFAIASGGFFTKKAMTQEGAMQKDLFNPANCKPSRSPIPIIEFHGDDDEMYVYDGNSVFDGPTYPITGWLRSWAERNSCDYSSGQKTSLLKGRVHKYNWECGVKSDKPILQHYLLHGVGHTWPSVSLLREGENFPDPMLFDGTPIIKEFFEAHELPDNAASETPKDETEKASTAEPEAETVKAEIKDEL